jgi:hypothetical protein
MTPLMTRNVKLIPAAVFLFDGVSLYFVMMTHFTLLFLLKETILCHCTRQFLMTGADTGFKTSYYSAFGKSLCTYKRCWK